MDIENNRREWEFPQSPVEANPLQVKDGFDNAKIEFELSSADAEISPDKDAGPFEVEAEVIVLSGLFCSCIHAHIFLSRSSFFF